MNLLWLVFGGIFTAMEYLVASFRVCIPNGIPIMVIIINKLATRYSVRYANSENGFTSIVAFR